MNPDQQNELLAAFNQQQAFVRELEARYNQQQQQIAHLLLTNQPTVHRDPDVERTTEPSSHSNEPKPPKPETYDGTVLATGRNKAHTWLAEMDQFLKACRVPESRRVTTATVYLRGTALLSWIAADKAAPGSIATWPQFEAWFRGRFQPIAAERTARAALRRLRQHPGRPVSSYNDEFLRLVQMIPPESMGELDRIDHYKAGLREREIVRWIDRQDPRTLLEAMEQAQLEDLRDFDANRRGFAPRPFPSHPASSSAHQSVPMELGHLYGADEYGAYEDEWGQDEAKYSDAPPPPAPGPQLNALAYRPAARRAPAPGAAAASQYPSKLTPAERARCIKEHLCFRCRQKGHGTANCPSFAERRAGVPQGKGQAQ